MLLSLFWLRRFWVRCGWRWLGLRLHGRLFWWLTLLRRGARVTLANVEVPESTDVTVQRAGREVRVRSSEPVRLEQNYLDWISPLKELDATSAEQLQQAASELPGYVPGGQHFFPIATYLGAFERHVSWDVEFVHRCRASQNVAMHSPALRNPSAATLQIPEPTTVLWIYTRPRR